MARVRTIRRRVVAGAVALFVTVWLLIAITLIYGHDPALAHQAASKTTSATSGNTSSTTTTTSAATAPTSTPSSVTTRQS
jgi:hypothetical protein